MATSFPYLTIARGCGVPYAQVLAQLARWDGKRCNGMDLWPEPEPEIKQAIWGRLVGGKRTAQTSLMLHRNRGKSDVAIPPQRAA